MALTLFSIIRDARCDDQPVDLAGTGGPLVIVVIGPLVPMHTKTEACRPAQFVLTAGFQL